MARRGGDPPRVLVTDAADRSVLATCRGLHAAGYEVVVAGCGRFNASHWSRCCSERLRLADARADARRFTDGLRAYLERRPCAAVIAGTDVSLWAISSAREQLEPLTRLGLPPRPAVEESLDRQALARAASSAGLEAPCSVRCEDPDQAIALAGELGYPLLLKSVRTVRERSPSVEPGANTQRIDTPADLRSALATAQPPFLLQRSEAGTPLSVGGVVADGRLLGLACSRYRRTWPPLKGNAAFSTTIEPPDGLDQRVLALVLELGWEGIFELELIEMRRGALVAIDFNPRPYGSMALAIAAGANLPALWCDWLLGRPADPARARAGRSYRWEDADLRHLVWQLRRGNWRAALGVARPHRAVVHPHFAASDPLPLLARALWLLGGRRL